jgi:hypothetical protein
MKYNLLSIACILILISLIFVLVFKQVKENFSQYNPVIQILKENVIACFPELGNIKIYEGDKSYTINKEKIYLCIRDKDGQYYNQNILMYVLLHEIAHTLCPEIGHTQSFKDIFNSLIERANAHGIYTHVDIPKDYCLE